MKQFVKGHTYYTTTKNGDLRLFEVTGVLQSKATKEHLVVIGKFNGRCERRYEIRHTSGGGDNVEQSEYIIVDERYATVICAKYEYVG